MKFVFATVLASSSVVAHADMEGLFRGRRVSSEKRNLDSYPDPEDPNCPLSGARPGKEILKQYCETGVIDIFPGIQGPPMQAAAMTPPAGKKGGGESGKGGKRGGMSMPDEAEDDCPCKTELYLRRFDNEVCHRSPEATGDVMFLPIPPFDFLGTSYQCFGPVVAACDGTRPIGETVGRYNEHTVEVFSEDCCDTKQVTWRSDAAADRKDGDYDGETCEVTGALYTTGQLFLDNPDSPFSTYLNYARSVVYDPETGPSTSDFTTIDGGGPSSAITGSETYVGFFCEGVTPSSPCYAVYLLYLCEGEWSPCGLWDSEEALKISQPVCDGDSLTDPTPSGLCPSLPHNEYPIKSLPDANVEQADQKETVAKDETAP
jgi:hypothetical protein